MKRLTLFLLTIAIIALFGSNAYAATIAETYGISPKGMAMGNAMASHVNDWSSVYYNVAGLGRTAHIPDGGSPNELFIGYLRTAPQTDLDIPRRYEETGGVRTYYDTNADEDLDFGSFVIGAALDLNQLYQLPKAISSGRFGITVAIGDDLTVAKANDVEPQTHNYMRFGREAQQMMLMTGFGFGFLDDAFGLGFGIKSSFGGEGRILLEDVQVGTEEQTPRQQTTMDLELDISAWVAGGYIDFGRISDALTGLNLGIAYRQESKFEIDPFNTAAVVEVGGIPLNLALSIFDYYHPASYTAGISYRFSNRFLISIDVEYQTWSEYDVSSNQAYNDTAILPDLDDIWIPKVGLQYNATTRTSLYLGYYFQPSFFPDEAVTAEVNWLDNDKHVASIGMSYDAGRWAGFKKPMVFHLGYQLQYLVERDVTKTTPTTLNPNYSYGGMVHTVIVGTSF